MPEGVRITPDIGKICPEDSQKFIVEFSSKVKKELVQHEFYIFVRGSKKLKVIFSAQTILPDIQIEQTCFDFQQITFGTKGTLDMTIQNLSPIYAELLLKLISQNPHLQEKYDCIEVLEPEEENANDSLVFEKLNEGFSNEDNISEKNQISNELGLNSRNYIFYLKSERTYHFRIRFSPVKPAKYNFDLVLYIPGHEKCPLLVRKVKCIGSNPKFLMEPLHGYIEFPKKIIISSDSVFPEYKSLTISNPNFDEPLIWRFDEHIINNQKEFSISPTSGVIEPQCTISLDIGFKPFKPMVYDLSIPLYFKNDDAPYTEIKLKGEGAYPKLLFEVEEVILDIVPLNQTSSYILNIYNDGYNNSIISSIIVQEISKIPLSVKFLNGSSIGINNPKLEIEISFTSKVPISFTTRIDFEDDQKRVFPIFISGTADNSILTNYIYFVKNNNYTVEFKESKGPHLMKM